VSTAAHTSRSLASLHDRRTKVLAEPDVVAAIDRGGTSPALRAAVTAWPPRSTASTTHSTARRHRRDRRGIACGQQDRPQEHGARPPLHDVPAVFRQAHEGASACEVLGVTIDAHGPNWGCNHCGWTGPPKGNGADRATDLISYDYSGTKGERLRKIRNLPGRTPRFWWQHWDGKEWAKGTGGAKPAIYRYEEVKEAIANGYRIVCAEGEKDVDNLWTLGIPATCNPDGAAEPGQRPKWRIEHSEMLRGADLVVMGDNDPPGRAHVEATASTSAGIANSVGTLDLARHWEGLKDGGDVSDIIDDGISREKLDLLLDAAPIWEPPLSGDGIGQRNPQPEPVQLEFIAFWYGDEAVEDARSWLVYGTMAEVGAGLLSGQWGTYKTFVADDIAAAVMTGTPIFGGATPGFHHGA
jgi:hypothetical protein